MRSRGIDSLVVGGLTTPICVQASVDALSMADFKVTVLQDACASQAIGALSADDAHDAALQRTAYLFAAVCPTGTFTDAVTSANL